MDDPVGFLNKNALSIAGGTTYNSGLRIFTMETFNYGEIDTVGVNWSSKKKVQRWRASVTADTSSRPLRRFTRGTAEYAEFRAYYVAMKQVGENVATTHFTLPNTGGPDLMLTSQLTGCTFGYGSQAPGSGCLVSHIQPVGGGVGGLSEIGKAGLKRQVLGPMNGGGTALETDGTATTTVVGKRTGGTWSFYRQVNERGGNKVMLASAPI
jgi:hypothetical protein